LQCVARGIFCGIWNNIKFRRYFRAGMIAVDEVVKTEVSNTARHVVERGLREESDAISQQLWLFIKKQGMPAFSALVLI
jgi:hypothetical protein